MSRCLQALVLLGCTALQLCRGLDNGVARKPQMGFAPWNFAGVHSTCYVTACCNLVCQCLAALILAWQLGIWHQTGLGTACTCANTPLPFLGL